MQCDTRDFGAVDIQISDVLHFIQPPFGFEEFNQYVLLFDDEMEVGFAWMQSTQNKELCFILLDGGFFAPKHTIEIPDTVRAELGEGNISAFVICVVPEDGKGATANLKSPIFINEDTKKGTQAILPQDFPVRQPLIEQGA